MQKSIPTLTTSFDLHLQPHQIPKWRGAVAEAAGWENDRFHNHARTQVVPEKVSVSSSNIQVLPSPLTPVTLQNKFIYRYPTIQYRVQKGNAAIFAVGHGVADLRRWLLQKESKIQIGGQPRTLMIKNLRENTHTLRMLPVKKAYSLMDFQPFNQRNYRIWQKADDLHERVKLLETILVGNILNLASNLDWKIPERLEVSILNIRDTKMVKTHGTQRMAFNLVYKANIDLPPGIGLGRAVSHGFGVSMPCRNQV